MLPLEKLAMVKVYPVASAGSLLTLICPAAPGDPVDVKYLASA